MPRRPSTTVVLRGNFGSFPELVRVYAYDAEAAVALARVRYGDGQEVLDRFDLADLEAFLTDGPRTFVDAHAWLCHVAEDLFGAARPQPDHLPGVPS